MPTLLPRSTLLRSQTTQLTILPLPSSRQASTPILSIPISPTLFPLMLALDDTAAVTILYLLHSLLICNLLLIHACYPKLFSIGWVEPQTETHLSRLPRWTLRRPEHRDRRSDPGTARHFPLKLLHTTGLLSSAKGDTSSALLMITLWVSY